MHHTELSFSEQERLTRNNALLKSYSNEIAKMDNRLITFISFLYHGYNKKNDMSLQAIHPTSQTQYKSFFIIFITNVKCNTLFS